MRLAALLLAAGEGRRFGACKQIAEVDGKPLIRHALDALLPLFGEHLFVVVGAHRERVRPLIGEPARVIEHPGWAQGLGSSIARGVSAIEASEPFDGLLIALADQPRISRADYRRLLETFDGERAAATEYGDRFGVPAVFPPHWFDALERLEGDRGASMLLTESAEPPIGVSIAAAAFDIDLETYL